MKKLPDFLILGAAKAGTTAMFRALSRHPGIYCSPVKEPRFFAYAGSGRVPLHTCPAANAFKDSIVTEAQYLELFAACPESRKAGEASPIYLSSAEAPFAARQYVPHCRLIVILRHPVERAYSQWLHNRQGGREMLGDFESAWAAEEERREKGWAHVWEYRYRGFYARQLDTWLQFFERDQILVLFYENWVQRPEETLAAVCKHIGVEPLPALKITRENVTSRQPRWPLLHHMMVRENLLRRLAQRILPLAVRDAITGNIHRINLKPGPKLDPDLRARLAKVYHDDIRWLEKLTGTNLERWKS